MSQESVFENDPPRLPPAPLWDQLLPRVADADPVVADIELPREGVTGNDRLGVSVELPLTLPEVICTCDGRANCCSLVLTRLNRI